MQVLRSGGRWIDAPSSYGPRKTLYNRFVRWAAKAGPPATLNFASDGTRMIRAVGNLEAPFQIDVVMTASELATLPLELARGPCGQTLLGRAESDIELTRRIRLPTVQRTTRGQSNTSRLVI